MDFQGPFSEFNDQLDKLYLGWRNQETPDRTRLFHYTTVAGLIGIADNRKLWASNAYYLNDSSEPSYADQILRESLSVVRTELGSNLVGEVFEQFWQWADERLLSGTDVPDTYVFCLSEEDDLLSQWRAYGDLGSGYVVGFSSSRLVELARQLSGGRYIVRVVYEEASQRAEAANVFRELATRFQNYLRAASDAGDLERDWIRGKLRSSLISEIIRLRSRFKIPAYREEREWRIVQFVPRDSSQYPIIFRSNRGRLVPYLELAFGDPDRPDRLPIEQITLGPTLDPDSGKRTVQLLLKKRGYTNVDVEKSSVPFRL